MDTASTKITKKDLINEALAKKKYELWACVKPALSERKAQSMKNTPMRDYDYIGNKRRNS